jgi:hypothetical protein
MLGLVKFYLKMVSVMGVATLLFLAFILNYKGESRGLNRVKNKVEKSKIFKNTKFSYKNNRQKYSRILRSEYIKAKRNPLRGVPVVILLIIMIRLSLRLKTKVLKKDVVKIILKEMELIYEEQTKEQDFYTNYLGKKVPKLDKLGNKVFKIIEHVPRIKRTDSGATINNVHPKAEANLFKYQNGLLRALELADVIDFETGIISPTGFPGQFDIAKLSRAAADEMDLFKRIGWFKKGIENGIQKDFYPNAVIDKEELKVTLYLNGLTLTEENIKKGHSAFSNFHNISLDKKYENFHDRYEIPILETVKSKWAKGDICDNMGLWEESVIDRMRDKDAEHWYLGEIIDPNIRYSEPEIFWPIATAPHCLIAGATRSGKTKTGGGVIIDVAQAYPNAEFYFGDAKASADWIPFADKLSPYPVAFPNPNDPTIEFANIVLEVWNKFMERRKISEEASSLGYKCSTYLELRTAAIEEGRPEWNLGRIFLVIDEFAALQTLMVDPKKLINAENSILWMIKRLLAEAASYGISIILLSQRVQVDSYPSSIRSNLTIRLLHIMSSNDANFLETPELTSLRTGEYILQANGLLDDNNTQKFKCRHLYIGDSSQKVLEGLDFTTPGKQDWDMDLLYNTGESQKIQDMDMNGVSKYVKQCFFKREGFNILESSPADEKTISLVAEKDGITYGVGFPDINELLDQTFFEDAKIEQPNLDDMFQIWFITGKEVNSASKKEALQKLISDHPNALILIKQDYIRKLKIAYGFYQREDETIVFQKLLDDISTKKEDQVQANIDDLYGITRDTSGNIVDQYTDEYVNLDKLSEIKKIRNPKEKGDEFERFMMAIELGLNYDTQYARELIERQEVKFKTANKRAEGGVDLVRWTNRITKSAIIIQLKNQTSKSLNTNVMDKLTKSEFLYKGLGINVVGKLLITTGTLTKQAKEEAKIMGIDIIDGEGVKKLVKSYCLQKSEAEHNSK